MSTSTSPVQQSALEFKSTSLTVPILLLFGNDLAEIDLQLKDKVSQAPEFFKNSPVLIDLQKLTGQNLDIDIRDLVELLRRQVFMPIGVRGGTEKQHQDALALNLPIFSVRSSNSEININAEPKPLPAPVEEQSKPVELVSVPENKLITHPVRSGQRIYSKGDLIVTATVSAGAEIMAEGNIHVYGTLRGRALAGVQGDVESRIFCSDLQAELISIAGIYQISDELSPDTAHKPVQISLDNQTLIIQDI